MALTKRYPGVTALDDVSFEVRAGEVLGFLGKNGAGKTTAMRILTGFLPASAGRVEVCGLDLEAEPERARAQMGYLPENVPLYPELRVEEYLRYRAALKGVHRRERAARVDEALERVGASPERRRVIGRLSKGYRQRVGLADALLHRPEALILDEPTDGLDPSQRAEVLELIGRLGRERAVILSTHVLPEVERVCSRVVILDRGRVIATGTPAELGRPFQQLRVVARAAPEALAQAVRAVPGVERVTVASGGEGPEGEVVLIVDSSADAREGIARASLGVGELRELRPLHPGLDEVFARLTTPTSGKPA
jgi:ABC-2 type transport system ATP-binding protein